MKRRSPGRRGRAAAAPWLAPRPADPEAVRARQAAMEVLLDNQELARRRAAIDADMAAAMAPAPKAPLPRRPAPAHPILVVPVRRVVTSTSLAILVRAWDLEFWVPKSAVHHHDVDAIRSGWSGDLEVSSSWAMSVGLPPEWKTTPNTGRSTK